MTQKVLTIGALAKATATKVETIRCYERIGLLPLPARTDGNYRVYGAAHFDRLGLVRRCRDLGFGIETVRELLRLADQRERDCGEVIRVAETHLAEVEHKIADLIRLTRQLRELRAQCAGGTIDRCGIIKSLSPRHDQTKDGGVPSTMAGQARGPRGVGWAAASRAATKSERRRETPTKQPRKDLNGA